MKIAVIVIGRGSSDPDANADFCKVVRLFGEGRNLGWVLPSFIGITRPLFEETVELVARTRPERIVIVPYFLFGGRLIVKLCQQVAGVRSRYPSINIRQAAYLGSDPGLFSLMDDRVNERSQARALCHVIPVNTAFRFPVYPTRWGETNVQELAHEHLLYDRSSPLTDCRAWIGLVCILTRAGQQRAQRD